MANSSANLKENKKTAAAPREKSTFRHWSPVCIGVLFVVTAIIFSSFIFSDKMMLSSDELSGVDMKELTRASVINHGQTPAWFSTRLSGMPSVDAMFGDAFYPPTMLMRLFLPAYRSFGFMMVIHVFLAGMFFFLMLRRSFGIARLGALGGALFYMLSPQFVSHVNPGHSGKMFVIAWLPFIVWRLRSLLAIPTLRNVALIGIGIAAMLLTSHVQMSYFVLWGVFLYWVTDMVLALRAKEEKRKMLFKGVFFWAAVFLGLGVSFAALYPSFMFVREAFSVRGVDRGFEHAASWSLHWAEFFSLWVHEFGNSLQYYWGKNYFKLNTEYSGMIPLLLSVLAIVSKPKSMWRVFWGAIAVLAVLFSLGANTPLFSILYHTIPGVKSFRAPSMIMFWFTFATALMSVFFIKDLLSRRFEITGDKLRRWNTGLWIALGGVTLAAILFSVESLVTSFAASMMGEGDAHRVFQINFKEKFVPALWLWWFFTAAALGMFIAMINGKIKSSTFVCALIIMGTIDMVKVNNQFYSVDSPRRHFYQNDPTLNELKREFAKAPFRVFSLPQTFPMQQNQEGVYGLEGVSGFHDNELNSYRAFRGDQRDVNFIGDIMSMQRRGGLHINTPFLDLANVDYILESSGRGGVNRIKNPTALGRLSYASDFVVLPEDEIISALKSGRYNYRTTVALLEEPKLPFNKNDRGDDRQKSSAINGVDADVNTDNNAGDTANDARRDDRPRSSVGNDTQTTVSDDTKLLTPIDNKQLKTEWKKYTTNLRIAKVTMPADGFLRLSEVYYPGWRIKIDGTPVKYYRSDMTWMAIPLKVGSYEVIMEPRSLYLDDAKKVTAVSALIVIVILSFGFIRRRSKTA